MRQRSGHDTVPSPVHFGEPRSSCLDETWLTLDVAPGFCYGQFPLDDYPGFLSDGTSTSPPLHPNHDPRVLRS
jgi:hypothetical protein